MNDNTQPARKQLFMNDQWLDLITVSSQRLCAYLQAEIQSRFPHVLITSLSIGAEQGEGPLAIDYSMRVESDADFVPSKVKKEIDLLIQRISPAFVRLCEDLDDERIALAKELDRIAGRQFKVRSRFERAVDRLLVTQ